MSNSDRLNTPAKIGAAIRAHRTNGGWTQAELAKAVGVSRKWLVEIERGKETVELGLVLKVMNKMGMELGVLPPKGLTDVERAVIAAHMSKL